ncbi:tetratricopeptide repeat protein [Streptomyces phyllanthi]|uniref:Tetratricopeptide repeat protein n=1 Tax=Streptomyces phyllanthi TaxID=1803180 RepID=A0A5N8WDH1_9ACTN|nr:tetratricopeptide repeat protein [Streptomyces phyllanthi]MPY45457.1 tetratricopeptide repeat protein [Streptomyces phyllanthi]
MESEKGLEEGQSKPAGRTRRRVLIGTAAVAGCAVLGGVLVLLPPDVWQSRPWSAPGPPERARVAVGAGAPAARSALTVRIDEQEARVRARPKDARAWAALGTAYGERGRRTGVVADFPKAERALQTSLKVRPTGNVEAYEGLAALALARGDFHTARRWGEEAVETAPQRWTAYPPLIDAHCGLGDMEAADSSLNRLLALRSAPAVTAVAARLYWEQGRSEDAAAAISEAAAHARSRAERARYLVRAAELAWQRGERGKSLNYSTAALRAAPEDHAALAGQARALAALGRTERAVRTYRSALAKAQLPRYALELGELHEAQGRRDLARAQYEVLREAVREGTAARVNNSLLLGLFEADHGAPKEAVRLLRAEWKRHPSLRVADALGWALHRTGQDREALGFAKQATEKRYRGEVRDALYAYHRGEIERALRRPGPARRQLAEALRVNPYFSPLHAPAAMRALKELGEPSGKAPK